ncbi:uncharacterized protein N7511_004392 [Penicillium nucicola]|uniref:uncharacterized protein n=1 Tax=Penicillium nucicola TaxID=1850975 RepID=UPI0025457C79|nr:uncharacterized protein N7511_004392 [Penicillium nucicola]KAJ5766776.1 hypothetical protein N7511_004392 [Penicillium nucicola]
MVYGGKPSTGCQNCRKRHIKCDETRPHCQACTRTKRECPGYPDPFDLMLRDHTHSFRKPVRASRSPATSNSSRSSSRAIELPEQPVSSKRPLALGPVDLYAKTPMITTRWPPLLGPADLYQPMEDTVVPLFFNSYLYLPKDPHIRNGFMEILPVSFSNAKPQSHLYVSTLAVAFFSVAAWTGQSCLLRASEQYFTQALPKIRESLQNENSDLDSILLSILLLSTYEEFVAVKDWEKPVKAHLRGAVALINNRKSKKLQTATSRTIDHAVQTQIIKTSRGLTSPTVPTPKIWPLSHPVSSSGPRPLLASAASQIVNLRVQWERIIEKPANGAAVTSLLNKAIEIDTNLAAWAHLVPPHWTPVAASIIPDSVRKAGIYNIRVDCYTDMWIASTWNTYRDCRILVQSIILSCLRMESSLDSQGLKTMMATATAHRLADEICASVPYFLGSQVESVRMRTGLVEYPYAETRPVSQTHKQIAPLMGAWFVLPCLRNLQAGVLGLPSEQIDWLNGQIERVRVIYFQT